MAHGLSQEQLDAIATSLEMVPEVEAIMKRAKLAGLDIGDREARLKEVSAKLKGIQQAFTG